VREADNGPDPVSRKFLYLAESNRIDMYRMYESDIRESPARRSSAPILMIMFGCIVIGSFAGLMIADPDALSVLKTKTAGLISTDNGNLFAGIKAAISGTKDQSAAESNAQTASGTISTGVSSVGTIHYSPRTESTQLTFDLEDMGLIRTGKLRNPNRVYIDLKDNGQGQDSLTELETQREFGIDDGLVTRVRMVKRKSGVMRIVLDLKQLCDFTYMIPHETPSRLIVQLRPV